MTKENLESLKLKIERLRKLDKTAIVYQLWMQSIYNLLFVDFGYWKKSASAATKVAKEYANAASRSESTIIDRVMSILHQLVLSIDRELKKLSATI